MTVHPVFVPVVDEHVAATISLPEGQARGLAVLLPGFGATRSHRNRLWTKTSMALAERGIATVRLDYPGMGDSTGVHAHSMSQPPVPAVAEAMKVALHVADVKSYCVVGNCLGAQTALRIPEVIEGCVGVGLVLPGNLASILADESHRRMTSQAKRFAHRVRSVRRVARFFHRRPPGHSVRLMPEVEALIGTGRMLFLYMGEEERWRRLSRGLNASIRRAGAGAAERVERVFVPTEGSYELQPLASQEAVLRVIPTWVDRALSDEDNWSSPELLPEQVVD